MDFERNWTHANNRGEDVAGPGHDNYLYRPQPSLGLFYRHQPDVSVGSEQRKTDQPIIVRQP